MKCLASLLVLVAGIYSQSLAQTVVTNDIAPSIRWAESDTDDLVGYKVYVRKREGTKVWTKSIPVGNTNRFTFSPINLFRNATNEICVVAFNEEGQEADPSDKLFYYYKPKPKRVPRVQFEGEVRQRALDLDRSQPSEPTPVPPTPPGVNEFRQKKEVQKDAIQRKHRLQREAEEIDKLESRRPK